VIIASFAVVSADVATLTTLNVGRDIVSKAFGSRVSATTKAVSSSLRTEATTGWGQIVSYVSQTSCSGSITGVVDVALGVCIPLAFVNPTDLGTIVTATSTSITVTGYSDLSCATQSTAGTNPQFESTGCSKGSGSDGATQVNVFLSQATVPSTPLTSKYFQAR